MDWFTEVMVEFGSDEIMDLTEKDLIWLGFLGLGGGWKGVWLLTRFFWLGEERNKGLSIFKVILQIV